MAKDSKVKGGIHYERCPSCAERLAEGVTQCGACGWTLREHFEQGGSHCRYRAGKRTCKFPASIEQDGRRTCRFHYDCNDPIYGEAVIEESEAWARAAERDELPVLFLTTERGIKLPTYLTLQQQGMLHAQRVAEFIKARKLDRRKGEGRSDHAKRVRNEGMKRLSSFTLDKLARDA